MNNIISIEATSRVKELREYYLKNAPLSVNRDLLVWKCHRSLFLYSEGWKKSSDALTVRMRRAKSEAFLLANTRPIIVRGELLTGQPDLRDFSEEEAKLFNAQEGERKCIPMRVGRFDHLAMDYNLLLKNGINGMLKLLQDKIDELNLNDGSCVEKYEYYKCCTIELEGLKILCENYAKEVHRLYEQSEGKEKEDYKKLYDVVKNVPINPARTFHEALQSIHMYTWSMYGIFSYGKPDTYLLPYYKHDIDEGIISIEEAQELIDCFYLLNIANMSAWAAQGMMLSGRDKDGNKVENELTWHFLKAIEHTHIPDPNIGFCVTEETSDEILDYVSKIIVGGHCQPQVWNSDEVSRSMLKNGFDSEAANMFTLSTCVETTPIGRSGISITSPYINLLKVFLDAFEKCDNSYSFEDIFNAFKQEVESYFKEVILIENIKQLERRRNLTDPIRISLLVHSCLEKGMSHDCGGADYNQLEPNILGMQNTTESLNVIKQIIFDKKLVTIEEFKVILSKNYEGYEELLNTIRKKTTHFGTGDEVSNKIAKRVADTVIETCDKITTIRGAKVIPGAFSYRDHEYHGKITGASPDGRKSGDPLNDGSCPVQGYDTLGPTVSLSSTVSWEPSRFLGGISVNVKINSGIQPEKISAIIRGYLKTKGSQLQFNIVDQETLLKAQKNPENYENLLVRIGGYSDFFVKIPTSLQNEIISRAANNI